MLFTKANCHAKLHRYDTTMLLLAECERRFIAAGDVAALPELAARLMAYSARYWTANFSALIDSDLRYVEQVRRLIRVQIGAAPTERAWVSAASMTLAEALGLAAQSLQPPVQPR